MTSRLASLCLAAALLPGCMSVKYSSQGAVDHGASRGAVVHTWQHSLFLGLLPVSSVPIDGYCPHGVLHVRSSIGVLGGLATLFTAGVWTPTHVKVVCATWPEEYAVGAMHGDRPAGFDAHAATVEAPVDVAVPVQAPPPPPVAAAEPQPLAIPVETWEAPAGHGNTDTLVIETPDGTRVIVTR